MINDPMNPYASTSSELVETARENRFLSGVKRSLLASVIAATTCVVLVAAWALSLSGFPSPRRLRMEHPPIYLSELLTYVPPYSVATAILTVVGSLRINKNPDANQ